MADELDIGIIKSLVDKPRTAWGIAADLAYERMGRYQRTKMAGKIRYRLSRMIEDGYVMKNRTTHQYALENVLIGSGTLVLDLGDELVEEQIGMGTTLVVYFPEGTSVHFLDGN